MRLRSPGLQGLLIGSLVGVGFLASLAVLLVVLSTLESTIQRDQAAREGRALAQRLQVVGERNGLTLPVTSEEMKAYARGVRARVGGEVVVEWQSSPLSRRQTYQVPTTAEYLPRFSGAPPPGQAAISSDREATIARAVIYADDPTGAFGSTEVGQVVVASPIRGVSPELRVVQRRVFVAVVLVLALASLTGWALSRLIGKRASRLARTASQLAGGNLAARAPSGGPAEMQMLADSLNVMAGRLEGLVSDITHERDRATAMIGSLAEGVVAVGPDGHVTVANRAARRFLGIGRDAPVRRDDLPEEIAVMAREVLDPAAPPTLTGQVALPQGPVLELAAARIAEGGGAVLTLRDVTDARRLERARRDLVANVSHELKTPLAAIKGFQELLEDDSLGEDTRRDFLGLMKGEIARLERLVEEQLQLARLDSGGLPLERQRVDLADLAIGAAEPRRVLATRDGITMTVELAAEGPVIVDADPARIEQILIILLDNALRHTPEGGRVRVIVDRSQLDATVAVADTGEGIPPEDQEVVFDRFYRRDASRSRPGAGLGLAIARGLADAHGGTIELSSEVGAGSVFTLRLPLPPEDGPGEAGGSVEDDLSGAQTARVGGDA